MMKKYKWTLLIGCIVTALPMLVGLILWNRLPDEIATHFGSGNVANGWSSKPFTVFGIPGIMLALELVLYFVTTNDPKKRNIDDKIMRFCLWIIPVTSLLVCLSCYGIALGIPVGYRFSGKYPYRDHAHFPGELSPQDQTELYGGNQTSMDP